MISLHEDAVRVTWCMKHKTKILQAIQVRGKSLPNMNAAGKRKISILKDVVNTVRSSRCSVNLIKVSVY